MNSPSSNKSVLQMMKNKRKIVSGKTKTVAKVGASPYTFLGLPGSLRADLRYSEYFSLDPAAGALATYTYRANSIYDPNYSAGGHQPLGYDQLSVLYAHYIVQRAHIKVRVAGSIAGTAGVFTLSLLDGPTSPTPWTAITEQPRCKFMVLSGTGSASKDVPSLSIDFNAKSFFGVTDVNDNRDSIGALVGANPEDCAYFSISYQAADLSADMNAIGVVVTIEYDVLFSERENLAGS